MTRYALADYQVNLPAGLVADCSPNKRHAHWGQTIGPKVALRDATWALLLEAYPGIAANGAVPLEGPVLHLFAIGSRQWDRDNLVASCKAAIDMFEKLGILANDRDLRIGCVLSLRWPPGAFPDAWRRAQHDLVVLRAVSGPQWKREHRLGKGVDV